MQLTKYQLSDIIFSRLQQANGLNDVLQATLNAMMKVERQAEVESQPDNKANGYRPGRVYGHGQIMELRIPRDRNGAFYPKILALLRAQQTETERLVSALYGKGLTQQQIGEVFDELYGRHYSSSTISRMIEWMREEIGQWLARPLLAYYPIVYVDGFHVKVRRDRVASEVFYVVLAVTPEGKREVLTIAHMPTEGARGWGQVAAELRRRGLKHIGLLVADGLPGLDGAISEHLNIGGFQRCVTHLKRDLLARVRTEDKPALAEDLKWVFCTDDRYDDPEAGWRRWQHVCRRWSYKYKKFADMATNPDYQPCFTYLSYDYRIRSMIYTTNWIERLNRDFRRVMRIRGSMPDEDSVITLMGYVAREKQAWNRKLPNLHNDNKLFANRDSGEVPPPGDITLDN